MFQELARFEAASEDYVYMLERKVVELQEYAKKENASDKYIEKSKEHLQQLESFFNTTELAILAMAKQLSDMKQKNIELNLYKDRCKRLELLLKARGGNPDDANWIRESDYQLAAHLG